MRASPHDAPWAYPIPMAVVRPSRSGGWSALSGWWTVSWLPSGGTSGSGWTARDRSWPCCSSRVAGPVRNVAAYCVAEESFQVWPAAGAPKLPWPWSWADTRDTPGAPAPRPHHRRSSGWRWCIWWIEVQLDGVCSWCWGNSQLRVDSNRRFQRRSPLLPPRPAPLRDWSHCLADCSASSWGTAGTFGVIVSAWLGCCCWCCYCRWSCSCSPHRVPPPLLPRRRGTRSREGPAKRKEKSQLKYHSKERVLLVLISLMKTFFRLTTIFSRKWFRILKYYFSKIKWDS